MAKTLAKYFAQVEGGEEYIPVDILSAEGTLFKISVDGKEYVVDYSDSAQRMHSLIIDNVSYGIEITNKANKFEISRAFDIFKVEIMDEMKKYIKERVTKGLQGRQVIDTQMPGLILKVMVEKGQEVKAGDPLIVLVAMKMENEIKAPKDGVVQEIFVSEGNTVSTGDKLIIID
ncbi:MAG: biotin/lipoyl-binding protein [Deferribacteraceae bacterium]|jgi:biotin carboxyl carrier protein|nr:biotin/lipoyl-binding protein [Deferribacteraceae bacterium]